MVAEGKSLRGVNETLSIVKLNLFDRTSLMLVAEKPFLFNKEGGSNEKFKVIL